MAASVTSPPRPRPAGARAAWPLASVPAAQTRTSAGPSSAKRATTAASSVTSRRTSTTAAGAGGPARRSLAVLVSMVVVGPALGWFLFRLLGYEGRSVYALTLLSAPVFGVVWVPVYALGVWSLAGRLF